MLWPFITNPVQSDLDRATTCLMWPKMLFPWDSTHSNANSNHSKGIPTIQMQIPTIRRQIRTIQKGFQPFKCKFEPFEGKLEPFELDLKHSNANSNHSNGKSDHLNANYNHSNGIRTVRMQIRTIRHIRQKCCSHGDHIAVVATCYPIVRYHNNTYLFIMGNGPCYHNRGILYYRSVSSFFFV